MEDLLQARSLSLDVLHAFCQALCKTEAKPEAGSWPREIVLHLEFLLDKDVIQSLSMGFWPAKKVTVNNPNHSAAEAKRAHFPMDQLLTLDMTLVEELCIGSSFTTTVNADGEYDNTDCFDEPLTVMYDFLPETVLCGLNRLSSAFWRALQVLDLSWNGLHDAHVLPLTTGRWPLLQKLFLDYYQFALKGLKQLMRADWPVLAVLGLCGTGLDDISHDTANPAFTTQTLLHLYNCTWPDLVVLFETRHLEALMAVTCRPHKQTVTRLVDMS